MRALLSPEENLSPSTSSDMTSPHSDIQDEIGDIAEATTRPRKKSESPDCIKLKATVTRLQKTVSYLKKRRYQLISMIQKVLETFSEKFRTFLFRLSSRTDAFLIIKLNLISY